MNKNKLVRKISEHITWADAIRSDVASYNGINNYFTTKQLKNLVALAENIYEPLYNYFKKPIFITSFFRCKKVNDLIGGSKTSQHLANNGAAIDLDADVYGGLSNREIFYYTKNYLDFDQLIAEDVKADKSIGWVHVSYKSPEENRHEILTMKIVGGKYVYSKYDPKTLN
jgi:hypothetical protein